MERDTDTIEAIIMNRETDDVMYIKGDYAVWMPMGWASSFIKRNIFDSKSEVKYCDSTGYVRIVSVDGTIVLIE